MEKQVIFRDRQELQSADLNAIGAYASGALQHLTQDAIAATLHFTGGVVTAKSATEVDVASLPTPPQGYEIARVDVVVRLRKIDG